MLLALRSAFGLDGTPRAGAQFRAGRAGSSGAGTAASVTVQIPTTGSRGDVAAGDVAVLTVIGQTSTATLTAPAGWTLQSGPDVPINMVSWILTRTLQAGDPGTSVVAAVTPNSLLAAQLSIYSGVTEAGLQLALVNEATSNATTVVPAVAAVPEGGVLHVSLAHRYGGPLPPDVAVTLPYSQGEGSYGATAFTGSPNVAVEAAYQEAVPAGAYGGETFSLDTSRAPGSVSINYAIALPPSVAVGTNYTQTPADVAGAVDAATVVQDQVAGPSDAAAATDAARLDRGTTAGDAAGAVDAVSYVYTEGVGDTAAAVDSPWAGIVTRPAQLLNIGPGANQNHWSLQIAREGDSAITVIDQATLAAGYEETPYFTTRSENGVQAAEMYARLDAPVTTGTTTSRAELREVNPDGSNAAYDINAIYTEIHGFFRLMHGPAVKPDAVMMQLHNGDTHRIAIRTQTVSGTLRLRLHINGSSATTPELANPYVPGTWVEAKVRTDNGGAITVWVNDMANPIYTAPAGTLVPVVPAASWYWKAGVYNQTDAATGGNTEYGLVQHRDLTLTHTATTGAALTANPADVAGAVDAVTVTQSIVEPISDVAAATDAVSSQSDAVRAAADAAAGADAATVQASLARTAADTAGAVDAASIIQSAQQTASDVAAGTDSAGAVQAVSRSAADVAAAVDAASVVQSQAQTLADTAGATDAVAVVQNRAVTVNDTAGAVDAASASLSAVGAVTVGDTAGAVDSVTVVQGMARTATDVAAGVDAVTTQATRFVSVADVAAATDFVTSQILTGTNVFDTAGAMDAVSFVQTMSQTVTDTAAGTDATSAARGVTVADAAAGTDAVTPVLTGATAFVDTAAAVDAVSTAQGMTRAAADTAGAVDAAIVAQSIAQTVGDVAGAVDAVSISQTPTATAADVAAAADAVSATLSVQRSAADAAGAVDAVSTVAANARTVADVAAATDEVLAQIVVLATAADTAGAVDSVSFVRGVVQALGPDVAGVVDAVSTASARVAAAADTAGAVDAVSVQQAQAVTVADTAAAVDAVNAQLLQLISATAADVAAITDTVSVVRTQQQALTDAAGATDSVSYTMSRVVQVNDTAAVSDALAVRQDRTLILGDTLAVVDQVLLARGVVVTGDTAATSDTVDSITSQGVLAFYTWSRLRFYDVEPTAHDPSVVGCLRPAETGGRLRARTTGGTLEGVT